MVIISVPVQFCFVNVLLCFLVCLTKDYSFNYSIYQSGRATLTWPYYFEVIIRCLRMSDLPRGLSDALGFNYRYVQLCVVADRWDARLAPSPSPPLASTVLPARESYIVAGEALMKHYIACPNNIVAIVLRRRRNAGRRVLQVTPCLTLAQVTIVLYSLDFS